jgi:hypothetical protein
VTDSVPHRAASHPGRNGHIRGGGGGTDVRVPHVGIDFRPRPHRETGWAGSTVLAQARFSFFYSFSFILCFVIILSLKFKIQIYSRVKFPRIKSIILHILLLPL